MEPPSRATQTAVSLRRLYAWCVVAIVSSQVFSSHGFVTSGPVRFSYRYYGGTCQSAQQGQGGCLSSGSAPAAAGRSLSSSYSAAAASPEAAAPPRAYIRGAAAAGRGHASGGGAPARAGAATRGGSASPSAGALTPALFSEPLAGAAGEAAPVGETAAVEGAAAAPSAAAASAAPVDPALLEKIKEVVADQLKVDREKVKPESNFIKDLGADSLDSVELVMAFEEKFGVTIPDEEATKIATVQDALSYISKAENKNVTQA